ncbi:type I restriction enzyme S subunit [Kroppenstedtia sanguinis]|uniref:restriction endonuclease subunit S n=1 Tax=Kroppenstedtia sanguinis TaxID=1380684 RepID=UPI003D1F5967
MLTEALVPEEEQPYELPENWVWVRLGSLSKVTGGGTPKSSVEEYYNGEIPWITPADLSGYKDKYISQGKRNITKSGLKNSSAKLLPKNTLLLSSRAPVGYVALAANLLCTNQGFKSFPPTEAYVPDYGYWYLRFAKHIVDEFASGTTFKEISGSKAAKVPFPLPPLSEQKRIVDRVESLLGKIEEAKGLIQEARDSFEQRRAALLDRAFRGELTRTWREQHPDVEPADRLLERIREEKASMETQKGRRKKTTDYAPMDPPYELPEGWKWVRLGEIVNSFKNGIYKPKEYYDDIGVPCLRMYNIHQSELNFKDMHFLRLDPTEVDEYKLQYGDILINRVNSRELVGKCAAVPKEFPKSVFESKNIRARVCNHVNPFYLAYVLELGYVKELILNSSKQTVGMATINQAFMSNIPVPLCSYEEQCEIISAIHRIAHLEKEQLSLLSEVDCDELTQSILTQAFRGELGTHDPAEESALELLKRTLAEQNGLAYESPVRETLQVAEQGELYLP